MSKILFSHSYFLRFDPKQYSIGLPYAPLGTLYAAALMRERGHIVSVFDVMFCSDPAEITARLEEFQPDVFVMYDDGFNYLTKMCLTNMREASFKMLKLAKARNCVTVVSSSDATDHYSEYLEEGADFILKGEGEITLEELIAAIGSGTGNLESINGLAFKIGDTVVKTQPRSLLKNLDSLPLPAWDLIDISPYKRSWLKNAGYFSMNIATTRGCPFKCNWCAKPIYGNRYNSRTPANVVEELKLLKSKYSFDHIWFCDDIFGLKPGWVQEFAERVQHENLELKFKIQSRADLLMQEDYVRYLSDSGCENVWMGAESGSQKVLDAMDKGIQVQQIYDATRLLRRNHIKPSFFIQFGYPGEMKEDILLTVKMINELLPHQIGISVSYPLPGTVFYEKVKREMQKKSNWSDSNEMALMFSNTYKPPFYKQLHKYVHRSYRKRIAINQIKAFIKQPWKVDKSTIKKALSILYYVPATVYERYKLNLLEKA
jgi:anaerobic magnesium-protoporphyrin IX monomethyl ester cyclase